MESYEKLHVANNIEALDLVARRNCDPKKLTFKQICNGMSKLYENCQKKVLDQEEYYILLARYLALYNHLNLIQNDKKFLEIRFGSEHKKVLNQYKETKKSLEKRYLEKMQLISDKPVIEKSKEVISVKHQPIFEGEFISCEQLFSALQKNKNILLVDARPDTAFNESRIDHPNCINVPDHCITPGLSANTLGKKLPEISQKAWEKREKFDAIVLYDWNTSSEGFEFTKLSKLKSALVDWDLNCNYNEPPVVLNGGYLELLHMYPTICINPHVYLFQKNNELDELLELDNITYPTESDNKTLVMGSPEEPKLEPSQDDIKIESKEICLEEFKTLTDTRKLLIQQLKDQENEKNCLNQTYNNENNINVLADLKKKISDIDLEIYRLNESICDIERRKDEVKNRLSAEFETEIQDEPISNEIKDIVTDKNENSKKLKDIIDEERSKELQKARALKPKKSKDEDETSVKRPMINRSTKPNISTKPIVEPLENLTSGLIGMRNIRNTCYMSTLIQCLRNIPAIKKLFCEGIYAKNNIRNPAAIIHEVAGLIRQLWTKPGKSIEPYEFYNKVGQLEPTYKQGNHEDCMEFFLFLLNHLSEDCCYDVNIQKVLTTKQRAWFNQFEGKNSVFIDLFYHQIRITQTCDHCHTHSYKFEIESTFMLHVPEYDFSLEDLMEDYMADYIIPEYCCAKCKTPVRNQKKICYEPKIMVIVLKRYKHHNLTGKFSFSKIESKVHFQKNNFRLSESLYQLNAIVLHSGDMNFGHYTAAVLTPRGWFEFNDETVRPVNINDESLKVKACAFFYSMCDEKK